MTKDHGPSIKDDDGFVKLRDHGMRIKKAARIVNTEDANEKGGKAKKYEDRSKDELYKEATKVGIEGRSMMSKKHLIKALRYNN